MTKPPPICPLTSPISSNSRPPNHSPFFLKTSQTCSLTPTGQARVFQYLAFNPPFFFSLPQTQKHTYISRHHKIKHTKRNRNPSKSKRVSCMFQKVPDFPHRQQSITLRKPSFPQQAGNQSRRNHEVGKKDKKKPILLIFKK